ncbi:hypothetical protein C7T35_40025 [Variovorax sp. WS11]|nr:hypothetical protein C7T35_40025 [Variovorax sp. WS11]
MRIRDSGNASLVAGVGGFGAGGSTVRRGGGGAGLGGAIFVMEGGALTIGGNTEVRGNSVTGGASGGNGAQAGSAFGAGIFMQGSSTLTFVPGGGATQTFADAIADQTGSGGTGANAGSIGLVKGGDGRLVLSGANTYSGGTRVTGGTLSIAADHNLGAVSGTLTLDAGILQNTAAVATARAITIGNGAGFQTDADLTATGVISGTGSLAKTGAGTLTLAGVNTYSGGTSLWGGKVSVSSDANLGAFGPLAFDGGTLQVTGTAFTSTSRFVIWGSDGGGFDIVEGDATFSVGQALTKFGSLRKEGAGTLVLSGANTFMGGTTISAGTLVGSAGNFGSGTITNNAALRIDQSGDATFANTITGSGILTKTGTGTLKLTRANGHTGGTTVAGGTLELATTGAAGSGDITVDNSANRNATLQVDAGVHIDNAVFVSNQGTLNNSGAIAASNPAGPGVAVAVRGGTVNNSATGTIIGDGAGVTLEGGAGAVTNTGGLIQGGNGIGVRGACHSRQRSWWNHHWRGHWRPYAQRRHCGQ